MDDDYEEVHELSGYAADQLMKLLSDLDEDAFSDFICTVDNAIEIYDSVKTGKVIVPPNLAHFFPSKPLAQHMKPSERIKMANEFIHHAESMLEWMIKYSEIDNHIPSVVWNRETGEPETNDSGVSMAIVPERKRILVDDAYENSNILIQRPRRVFTQLLVEFISMARDENGVIKDAEFQQDMKRRQQPSLARQMLIEHIMQCGFNSYRHEPIDMTCRYDSLKGECTGLIIQILKIVLDDIGEGGKHGLKTATIFKDVVKIKKQVETK